MNYDQVIRELQDNLLVIAEIERRQSALLKEHSEHIGELIQYRLRIDQNLAEITDKLNSEMRAIINEPDVRQEFIRQGLIPVDSPSPDELRHFVKSEIARWGQIIQKVGLAGTE